MLNCKIQNITESSYFGVQGSRSLKVIDVGTSGKLASSACYEICSNSSLWISATVFTLVKSMTVKINNDFL